MAIGMDGVSDQSFKTLLYICQGAGRANFPQGIFVPAIKNETLPWLGSVKRV